LALTLPTSGGRSVGIVRRRTKAPEFLFHVSTIYEKFQMQLHQLLPTCTSPVPDKQRNSQLSLQVHERAKISRCTTKQRSYSLDMKYSYLTLINELVYVSLICSLHVLRDEHVIFILSLYHISSNVTKVKQQKKKNRQGTLRNDQTE
jgi:hypothetical protein